MGGVIKHQSDNGLDINVSLRRSGNEACNISRVEFRYTSGGQMASMSFDRINPRYGGITRRMLEDALRHLFSELKYRIKNGGRFFVWYSDGTDRALVESAAAEIAARDVVLTRVVDTLVANGMVKGLDVVKD